MTARFDAPIRYGSCSVWLLRLLWMGPARSRVVVDDEELRVTMGWAFRSTVPRSAVVAASVRDGGVWSRGVHGWRRRWLVNGAGDRLVDVDIDPPARAAVGPVPIRISRLTVTVDDPHALAAALA